MNFRHKFFAGCLFVLPGLVCAQYSGEVYSSFKQQYDQKDYAAVLNLKSAILAQVASQQDSITANVYFYLGNSYNETGQPDSALSFFERELTIRKKLKAADYRNYSNSLYNLIYAYNQNGLYHEALTVADELLKEDMAHYGNTSRQYVETALFYIETLSEQGNYKAAQAFAESTLAQLSAAHPLYPQVQSKRADMLAALGEYSKAEKIFKESLKGLRAQSGPNSLDEASALVNLAAMYVDEGFLIEAEEIYQKVLQIFRSTPGIEAKTRYYSSLNNYGVALLGLSRIEEASRIYDEVLEHDRSVYGQNHPYFAIALNNAGTAFLDAGDYQKSESYFQLALELEKSLGSDQSYDYASVLNNLGRMYVLSVQPRKGLPMLEQSGEIFAREVGTESLEYSTSLFNQGQGWMLLKSRKAKELLSQSLRIRQSKFGTAHPKYGETTAKLAVYEWMMNNPKGAQQQFQSTFNNFYQQIERYFPGLSEAEKTKFYYLGLRPAFEIFNSFVVQQHKAMPDLTGRMYDIQLNTKGLILYATTKVRNSIMRSGDQFTIAQYEAWLDMKEHITKLYSTADDAQVKVIDSLEREANQIEKELTKKSAAFDKNLKRKWNSWKEVQAALGPKDAAIEIVRFRDYTPDSGGYYTGQVRYAALIVKKTSKQPELIMLPNTGNAMEKKNLSYYRNAIKFELNDDFSYPLYWQPLAPFLVGVNRLFFSPDGVYNQISIPSLKNPATGKYVLEEVNVLQVTNTKDIVPQPPVRQQKISRAFLLGFPQYAIGKTTVEADVPATRKIARGERSGIMRFVGGANGIALLPGTKTEIEKITQILQKQQADREVYLSAEALEGRIKGINNHGLVHIATHGFFLDDPDFSEIGNASSRYIDNPLLRSGLVLAGAEDFLNSGEFVAADEEDGILTAMEVMDMLLDDTELVVLSACETGLGTVQNGEGVYGLRRAFTVAGARSLVMSLWSVDDAATQELMTTFYELWQSGIPKQQAFRESQLKLKERFPNPVYWAAFVMIGE
jgi:CHAT domain-containing protein/tetratricopeptide (TPR) repeat protein